MRSYCYYQSPIGRLLLVGQDGALVELHFPNKVEQLQIPEEWREMPERFSQPLLQLEQYFSGKRRTFDLSIVLQGTPFQKQVWEALSTIPFGRTSSYGEIARQIGKPKACRAVGMANRKNPIPIIIPCHRVIGQDGSLTGFGGGLAIKQQLLDLERQTTGA